MPKKKISVDRKLLTKILVVVGALVILGAGGWLVYNNSIKDGGTEEWTADDRGNLSAAIEDAEDASLSGDVDRAQEIYDQGIANSENDTETVTLTVMKAYSLFNEENYEDALSVAQEADDRWQRADTAALLGDIYAAQGNTDAARQQYQTAIDRLPEGEPEYETSKQIYESKIKDL